MTEKKLPKTSTEIKTPDTPEKPTIISEAENLAKKIRFKLPASKPQRSPDVQITNVLKGELMTSKEITSEITREISDYYLWLFRNTMHFVVCAPCENKGLKTRLTARQVFGAEEKFASSNQMDNASMPACPCCQNAMQAIYDSETLTDNFRQKLIESDESFLSLLRKKNGSLAGLAFAYITTLAREFNLEWGSKYPYMKSDLQQPEYQRSLERFLAGANQVFPGSSFDGSETILAWNCMSISPDAAGGLPLLMQNLFKKIPRDLKVLGDVEKGSYAHSIFRTVGGHDGTIFFEKNEKDILIGNNIGSVIDTFNLPPEEFKRKRQEALAKGLVSNKREELSSALKKSGGSEDWDRLATAYEREVFSITKTSEKKARIIEAICDGNHILVVGCGSATHLQENLLSQRNMKITACDFSEKMLIVSRKKFQHPDLQYQRGDTRKLPSEFRGQFDKVVSANSILPPSRKEVSQMYASINQALKNGGQLIAYLPSFTCCQEFLKKHPELEKEYGDKLDHEQCRFIDTVGWQCWHTEELIRQELVQAGFSNIAIKKVGCESDEEAKNLARLYKIDANVMKKEYWCFFVTAEKS